MNPLICMASPATGPHADEWICGREPDHGPGLHADIGERGAWNTTTEPDPDFGGALDFGGVLGEQIELVVAGTLAEAMGEFGIPHHDGPYCPTEDCQCAELAGQIEARAVVIAAGELGIPAGALS